MTQCAITFGWLPSATGREPMLEVTRMLDLAVPRPDEDDF